MKRKGQAKGKAKQSAAEGETEFVGGQILKIPLRNVQADAEFAGTLSLGEPGQEVSLVFDTGSDYLAVTSDLCVT